MATPSQQTLLAMLNGQAIQRTWWDEETSELCWSVELLDPMPGENSTLEQGSMTLIDMTSGAAETAFSVNKSNINTFRWEAKKHLGSQFFLGSAVLARNFTAPGAPREDGKFPWDVYSP